jgi:transglutaminase-like putative cysteine protease
VNKWAQHVLPYPGSPTSTLYSRRFLQGTKTTEEKINKIINYVQDDIRYMGVESGIGSIKPFAPEEVAKRRYGDCKDKSLLLVSLLKQVGVTKAYRHW